MKQGKALKAKAFVLTGFFIAGVIVGACYTLLTNPSDDGRKYNTAQLTEKLQYAVVEAGRLQCVVLRDKAELYNIPSALEGNVIERMSKGVRVDYLDLVSSQDKDESYAVTAVEMQFQRFWGRRHIIPAGTLVLLLRGDDGSGEVKGRVFVDGKYYEKNFSAAYLRFPYVGQWKKVEFNGKPGYMQYDALSDSKLM